METDYKRKWSFFALGLTISLFWVLPVFGQITIGSIDVGPYTNGSSIAVTFKIDNGICVLPGNEFQMYLSDASGNFASEVLIGKYNGFYSTYVNGDIPLATVPGSGYKVRIKSTNPVAVSAASSAFEIKAGTAVSAKITSTVLNAEKPETYGSCISKANNKLFFKNESSATAIVSATITDEGSRAITNIDFTTESQSFVAQQSHYTILATAIMPDGTKGTKAYLIVNNRAVTAFGTSGDNIVCLPLGALEFNVDITSASGIQNNFPGNTYIIGWGDETTTTYTLCDIKKAGGKVSHLYNRSSCGRISSTSNGTVYNAFNVSIRMNNDFCGDIGTPVSSYAKVVVKPVNSFAFGSPACTGGVVTFTNTSVLGQDPNTKTPECVPNSATYTWFVDGVVVESGKPRSYNFTSIFTTHGKHIIRLESNSADACGAEPVEMEICIQDKPQPAFSLSKTTVCVSEQVKATDISVLDNICDAGNTYEWVVSPAVGFANGSNSASKEPEFNFTKAGIYSVTLSITTPSCGPVVSTPQVIIVNETPTVKLSPDITLCNLAIYDFNNTTSGPTNTQFTGTTVDLADTYSWSVIPSGSGSFSFEGATNNNSKYPSIRFNNFDEYTVTVTHKNNCGTTSKSQKITFTTAPIVKAGIDQSVCYNGASFVLNGEITGARTSQTWIGGDGMFFPNRNDLKASYTPTLAEKNAGRVTLILRITTSLAQPCNQIDDEVILTIQPDISLTSSAAKTICSGNGVNYLPTNKIAGTVFNWVATADASISGFSTTGAGEITDILFNADAVNNAKVNYVITPQKNGCNGTPFTFIVDVAPIPIVTLSAAESTICSNQFSGITISSNLPNTSYAYSSIATGAITGNSFRTMPSKDPLINDILINKGTTTETVTYTISPISFNNCSSPSISITISVLPQAALANAGSDQKLCSGNVVALNGNNPAPNTGNWILTSGQTGASIVDPSLFNTAVSGLVAGEIYKFKWTISGPGACAPTSSETSIMYYLPISNGIIGLTTAVCAGQTNTIKGDSPTGGNGAYAYQWESSTDNNFWVSISSATSKDLTFETISPVFYRRLVNSAVCASISNAVKIDILPALTDNTISTNQTICLGGSATELVGSTPTGGNGLFSYQWQSSLDGVSFSDVPGAAVSNYSPPIPKVTIFYRRYIFSGCAASASNTVTLRVNPPAKAEIKYMIDKGCAPFKLDATNVAAVLFPDRNDTYSWFANNIQIGVGAIFPGYVLTGNDETVIIKLVTTSNLGCASDERTHSFSTLSDVKANYTQNIASGCGPLNVTFNNTSSSLSSATYKWDFGNGTTSNLAQPATVIYQPNLKGKDITYTVVLEAKTPCGLSTYTSTVFVKASPISVFSPDKTDGCSPFTVTFSNTSPSNDRTYTYDFGDGVTLTKTDKTSVTHTYTTLTVKDYVVKMVAANDCGTSESQYNIRVAPNAITPEMVVNSNQKRGCAPFKVDFYNNTKGATTFVYDFGDGSKALTNIAPEVVTHTFTRVGKYTVTLYASNGCSNASTTEIIEVLDQPNVSFTADKTSGCDGVTVKFKNTSLNAVTYTWDFGDGSTSNEFEPIHTYSGAGSNYAVSLTATNILGCTNKATKPQYITIVAPGKADFVVTPGNELAIPNYSFGFKDISNGPVSWEWNFGDGTVSTLQNPNHTYNNEREYRVTLKVLNSGGCPSFAYQTVRIVGVPGFLNLPNSFMPASAVNELRTFKAKGRGILNWHMTIFNKWGQVLWETKQLDDGAPLEGWDGNFEGKEQQQGVYYWKIEVKFVNGGDWKGVTFDSSPPKKTGVIYLIR